MPLHSVQSDARRRARNHYLVLACTVNYNLAKGHPQGVLVETFCKHPYKVPISRFVGLPLTHFHR